MNIKKFKKIASFIKFLFTLISIFSIVGFIILLILFIFKRNSLILENPQLNLEMINLTKGEISESTILFAQLVTVSIKLLTSSYVFFKGKLFFDRLSKGKTPFSIANYKLLKEIGIILLVVSISIPLFYSLMITVNMSDGYYLSFGVNGLMIFGLLIYCVAEVIRYGITLQELSDETV